MNDLGLMNIELRTEQPEDYREMENVIREAFWNHYTPGCNEHYLIHIMRACPAFVPELDIVAAQDGRVIGNVVHLKAVIKGDDGNDYEVLSLGPIAVLPEFQGKGIGGKLISYTKNLAREMGYRAVFLYGDPDYYSQQGFVPAEQFGIRTADNMYAAAHQGCELYTNALSGLRGRYIEDAIYEVDETIAAEFDKAFPKKELVSGTPSQEKFEKIAAMRKEAFKNGS